MYTLFVLILTHIELTRSSPLAHKNIEQFGSRVFVGIRVSFCHTVEKMSVSGFLSHQSEGVDLMFDYDPQVPLDIQERACQKRGEVSIYDISYTGSSRQSVTAYLLVVGVG